VVRHAGATHADVTLRSDGDGGVVLVVRDDGAGLPDHAERDSNGLRGMRERALLVGANISIGRADGARMSIHLVTGVLLADDHPIVRHGLRDLLNAEADFRVVDEVDDGAAAVRRALEDDIHLAILDVTMPRMTGLQAARELAHRRPKLRILMLSMHENEQFLFEALRAGASGYVLKTAADRDLVQACRATMRGETFLYAGAVTALVKDYLGRASSRCSSASPRATRATRSPRSWSSAARPSTATARTCSRSSGCATATARPHAARR
jgi:DNA-binding NarL/FixJ family response regulator